MSRWAPWLLVLLIMAACLPQQEQPLPFETISHAEVINYREDNPKLLVITNTEELKLITFLSVADNTRESELLDKLRQLDYDHIFVILIFYGYVGSGGYDITVQQISRQGDQIFVRATFVSPKSNSLVTLGFTSPYHVVMVPRTGDWNATVRFVLLKENKLVAETTHFIP